ncbi:MAG: site-specific DNA-methyltransferase [Candidatus Heimdallarchaeota archaeon]|nr:site-specific DNA-methyltransferase [Candidatus Heimdallarchaeota archaeon]
MQHFKDKQKKGTETSSFGVTKRENHDSTKFYNSRLYKLLPKEQKVEYQENPIPSKFLDAIFCKSSERMEELPDYSVHLMVTSPPYNVSKEYDNDLTLKEYLQLLKTIFKEVYRVLVPGGRACINIANIGRKPYIPLHSYIIEAMLDLGFLMRGEIIWDKSASAGVSTAWGSWQSASNPVLRDVHEYILVFSKETFVLKKGNKQNSISKEDFLEFTKSLWRFPTESAKRVGHPAPFPVELPYRCIQLYTFQGDVVLDPMIGSGSTAIAALCSNRHFVGYDISREYVEICNQRIQNEKKKIAKEREQRKITEF